MRNRERTKVLGEVFTPPSMVEEILDRFPEEAFINEDETFLDPTCGSGNFLVGVKNRKLKNGLTKSQAVDAIFGADIMLDNCIEAILRLHFDIEDPEILKQEVEKVSADPTQNRSEYVEVIDVSSIVKEHFRFYDIPTTVLLAKPCQQKDIKRLEKHNLLVESLAYSETIKRFLRPGLIALFLNKKTGQIIPTIVQADGLLYTYDFGERELTEDELEDIRLTGVRI